MFGVVIRLGPAGSFLWTPEINNKFILINNEGYFENIEVLSIELFLNNIGNSTTVAEYDHILNMSLRLKINITEGLIAVIEEVLFKRT